MATLGFRFAFESEKGSEGGKKLKKRGKKIRLPMGDRGYREDFLEPHEKGGVGDAMRVPKPRRIPGSKPKRP